MLIVGAVSAVILGALVGTRFIPRHSPICIFSSLQTLEYALRLCTDLCPVTYITWDGPNIHLESSSDEVVVVDFG